MSWLRRYVAWAWPVVLLAGLLAVTAVRIGSGWGSGPRPTLGMETDGIVAGRSRKQWRCPSISDSLHNGSSSRDQLHRCIHTGCDHRDIAREWSLPT